MGRRLVIALFAPCPALLLIASCGLDAAGTRDPGDAAIETGPVGTGIPPSKADGAPLDAPASPDAADAGADVLVRPEGGPVHLGTGSGASAGLATVATAATMNGTLHLATISTKPFVNVTAVSGLGLAWSKVLAQCGGRSQTTVEVWSATGAPLVNTAITASFDNFVLNALMTVTQYSGATGTGVLQNANTTGPNGNCTTGVDGTAISVTLPTPAVDAIIFGASAIRSRAYTCGPGCTKLYEGHQGGAGDIVGLAIVESLLPTVSGTLDSDADWAVIGLELKP